MRPIQIRSAERGAGCLTALVFGAIVGAVVFVGYRVLPIFYNYYDLQNQFAGAIRSAAVESDSAIRRRLRRQIEEMGIPADPNRLVIDRGDGMMRIHLRYTEVLYLPWWDGEREVYHFHFTVVAEGEVE